jgi:carbonic anhydrase
MKKDKLLQKEYTPYSFKLTPIKEKSISKSLSSLFQLNNSFGTVYYESFKYYIRNIYFKFPSEHLMAGLGFSLEIQFEAFTVKDQGLIFVKLFEMIEDFENPSLNFLQMNSWADLAIYQKMELSDIDFNQIFSPQEEVIHSIVGKSEYEPKFVTDEIKESILEFNETPEIPFNEETPQFIEEKEFYYYTGQSTSGDCEYALVFISRKTEFIGMSQFNLMGLKAKSLQVKNLLEKSTEESEEDMDDLHNSIQVVHDNWQEVPEIYANFYYLNKFGETSSIGKIPFNTRLYVS